MPSQNMLPKGQRHRSVRAAYKAERGVKAPVPAPIPLLAFDPYAPGADAATHTISVPPEARGLRLDQYLAQAIPEISRSRVGLLIGNGQVLVNGLVTKAKHKLTPGESLVVKGSPRPAPLHATAEAIPLTIVYEDEYLAVVDKPAGMSVHAGNAAAVVVDDQVPAHDPRSAGTLVNALLHHFAGKLSGVGGDLRPGIVHRLDKQTSGLLLVAKDDVTHRKLAEAFAARTVHKNYIALAHGHLRRDDITVTLPIGRDLLRRTRMTTRRPPDAPGVRSALSSVHVLRRLRTDFGDFTLVQVTIETGRTHQIRVHLQALGHPIAGDTRYGAAGQLRAGERMLSLDRNFLHAAQLAFTHPRTGQALAFKAPLPPELNGFLAALSGGSTPDVTPNR